MGCWVGQLPSTQRMLDATVRVAPCDRVRLVALGTTDLIVLAGELY